MGAFVSPSSRAAPAQAGTGDDIPKATHVLADASASDAVSRAPSVPVMTRPTLPSSHKVAPVPNLTADVEDRASMRGRIVAYLQNKGGKCRAMEVMTAMGYVDKTGTL